MPFAQAGGFKHAGQHHFAPVALGFVIAFQRAGEVDGFLRHLGIQLLEVADLMRQSVSFARLLAEALLHLAAKTVELLAQRGE